MFIDETATTNPAYWGRHVLRAWYGTDTLVCPVDQPPSCGDDQWWHLVLPIAADCALRDGRVRKAVERAGKRCCSKLARPKPLIVIEAFRVGATHVELVVKGSFQDRSLVNARIRSAITRAYETARGKRLRWRLEWAAFVENPAERARCRARFGLPPDALEEPATPARRFERFKALLAS